MNTYMQNAQYRTIESLLYQTTVTSHSPRFAKLTKLRKTIPDCVSELHVHSSVQYAIKKS